MTCTEALRMHRWAEGNGVLRVYSGTRVRNRTRPNCTSVPVSTLQRKPSPKRRSPTPSPERRAPSPARRRSPTPEKRRSPTPEKRRTPTPEKRRSPTPEPEPEPEKMDEQERVRLARKGSVCLRINTVPFFFWAKNRFVFRKVLVVFSEARTAVAHE